MDKREITDTQVKIMQGFARAFKLAKALQDQFVDLPHDERAATFLFAAILAQYNYARTADPKLPERMQPTMGVAIGEHIKEVLPLLALAAGMIKSDAHMEDLISGMRPEEMPNYE